MHSKNGYIYVIDLKIDGLYKIGCSCNPKERIKALSASNPNIKAEIVRPVARMKRAERFLHKKFSYVRYTRELFRLNDEHILWIDNYLKNQADAHTLASNGFCPSCRSAMVIRTNKKSGHKFYGCSKYPVCTTTLPLRRVQKSPKI